jgi:phosphatidylinositol alpha-1,6-mannosyltransferase
VSHLFVTNDFPPKVGGIQTYLWELWRRLPPDRVTVLTTPHADAAGFDADQPYRVVRTKQRVLLPTPGLARQIRSLAHDVGAGAVVLDPALPLGLLGRHLHLPYALVVHGAEVTVPGHLPLARRLLRRVIGGADLIVAAGGYPATETRRVAGVRTPEIVVVPPGVDGQRFRPLSDDERRKARAAFGWADDAEVVVHVSRLVPRKGADVLIEAAARLAPQHPNLVVAIAGTGRDQARLAKLIDSTKAPARLLGRVSDAELPALYGAADVFAHLCRNRWAGLEQEGFGVVFLEAAAAGIPQVAGDSGGAAEAVVDGETGVVVHRPDRVDDVVEAIASLLSDRDHRRRLGEAARRRATAGFDYDDLAAQLDRVLLRLEGRSP